MITVIAVGKKHESWVSEGIKRYTQRLRQPWDVSWKLISHSPMTGDTARLEESRAIAARLNDNAFVILLDETGQLLNSPTLSDTLQQQFVAGKQVVVIIGGAHGVSDELKARSNVVWSLSRLVFPHQLVRLMLVEQLYRAQEIYRGGKYHHA